MWHEYETERLTALHDLAVLDTAPEQAFDRLAGLAAALFDAPIAALSLIDRDRQWFKARVGMDVCETPRQGAFSHHTIQAERHGVMVVEDASLDARFAATELVVGQGIRFYAGAVLTTAGGQNIGALCVKDTRPRPAPSAALLEHLRTLARLAVRELEAAQAAREARRKDMLMELVQNIAGVGHWRLDLRTGGLVWSDEVYRIRGAARGDLSLDYETAVSFYTPEGRQQIADAIRHVTATGEEIELRLQMARVDGEIRDTVLKSRCQVDESGRVVALFGVIQDITEHLRDLKATEESRRAYQLMTDHVKDVIARSNVKGQLFYISPSIEALTGYAPEELVGRSMIPHIHAEDAASFRQAYSDVIRGVRPSGQPVRYRIRHKAERWVWIEANPAMVRDEEGRPEFVDMLRDVTEQVALEMELTTTRDAANAAAQAQSDFLANMSHELRTPLTAVIGYAGILSARHELAPEPRRFVQKIRQASQALLTTINDVLDFSKLEAGQVEIRPEAVQLAGEIESVTGVLEQQARAKNLELLVSMGVDVPARLMLDPSRLRQVLMNLVGNAVKFTEAGSVSIFVDYEREGSTLFMRVTDTGSGLDEAQQQQLFKRFSQVDASSTRRHGGTGLGLAISKGLVEAMGGKIGVTSSPGQGTTFWFAIPSQSPELASAA